MSQPTATCDLCKAPIPAADFASGGAITVLRKSYCVRCKASVKNVTFQQAPSAPAPAPAKPAPPPKSTTSVRPSPPAQAKASSAHPKAASAPKATPAPKAPSSPKATPGPTGARRTPPPMRRPSKAIPFLIAGGLFALAGIGVAFLLTKEREKPKRNSAPETALSPEARAQKALNRFRDLAAEGGKPEETLKALEEARAAAKGTPLETQVEEARTAYEKKRESLEAERELHRLIDEIKALIAKDTEFREYATVLGKEKEAREKAARIAPPAVLQIQVIVQEYTERLEALAKPHVDEILPMAQGLAAEKRYDDAIRKIDTFPVNLRQSRSWQSLEALKRQYQSSK